MKDPDSSSDVKKNESTPEDMSLADLLGGGETDESSEPKRVDKRDDEPGSGMVRLAEMVASTSTEQARTPSIAPPPAMDATPTGGVATQPNQPVAAAAPAPAAKSHGPIYMLIVVVLLVGAGYYFMSNQKADTSAEDAKITALMEQMKKMQEDSANKSAAEATALQEKMAKMQAELETERAKKAAKEEEAKAEEADTGEAVAEEAKEEEKPEIKKTATRPTRGGSKAATSPTPKRVAEKAPSRADRTPTPKKESSAKGAKGPKGTAVLDELLGGGDKKQDEKKAGKKSAGGGSGLAKTPTKADVKAAMGPVGARAAKCSKYSTGTVMLRVTAGSNGRVKSSKALGSFAGTTAGKCVEMLARTAKLPKFSDATFTFTYPITLR